MQLRLALFTLCAALSACGLAATAAAQERLFAQPILSGANPYLPSEFSNTKLPVALRGFSAVALRDQQQWLSGQPQLQLVFDGQIYWFAGPRDRDIFAAAPYDYAPALGGDCIVTYVDTGERTLGKLELGLTHKGRLYFFAGADERDTFQANPTLYSDGDLANQGRCLVSQVDEGKAIMGLPATVAIINGLRYQFAGDYQRRQFASDSAHYGVQRALESAPQSAAEDNPQANAGSNTQNVQPNASGSRPSGDELEDADDQHYAMEGYCPVSIHEKGVWVRGTFDFHVDYESRRYVFPSEKEKELFTADPKKYVPVLGGDCIVSKTDDGRAEPGSVYHSLIFEGKLYLFAGPEQVKSFKDDPAKYTEPPAAPVATPPQDGVDPADVEQSEGNALREGRRSELGRRGVRR